MKTVVHRKIIHIDMDSFYASIEVIDNPYLKDKPVAIVVLQGVEYYALVIMKLENMVYILQCLHIRHCVNTSL